MPRIEHRDRYGTRLCLYGSKDGGLGVETLDRDGFPARIMVTFPTDQARQIVKDIESILEWEPGPDDNA